MEPITMNRPVLALRGLTAFPNETLSFDVERDISIYALDNAMENDRRLFLVTQKEISVADPTEEDLYRVGTICHILQIIKTSENSVRVIVEGEERARLHRMWQGKPFLQANVEVLEEEFPGKITPRVEAMLRRTYALRSWRRSSATTLSQRCWTAVTRDGWRTSSHRTSPCAIRIGSGCWRSCGPTGGSRSSTIS